MNQRRLYKDLPNVFQTSMAFGTRWVVVVPVNQRRFFVQRLPNVFQTSMAFGTRWVVVVQTSLVHWDCPALLWLYRNGHAHILKRILKCKRKGNCTRIPYKNEYCMNRRAPLNGQIDCSSLLPIELHCYYVVHCMQSGPGRGAQSVGHLTRKSGVLGSIPGLAIYFSFHFFKKGSCQLLAKVCARSTG